METDLAAVLTRVTALEANTALTDAVENPDRGSFRPTMATPPRFRSRRTRFDHGASLLCPEPQLGKLETWRSAHSARE